MKSETVIDMVRAETKRCADIADNMIRTCITDDERDIATTIRNLILATPEWLAEHRKAPALCGDGTPTDPSAPYPAGECVQAVRAEDGLTGE